MSQPSKTVISNVRIPSDESKNGFTGPSTVVLDGDVIGDDSTGDCVRVDGQGGFLIPGLIDAHVHLHSVSHLHMLAKAGVTTALDMGSWLPDIAKLRAAIASSHDEGIGLPDIRSAGCVMTAPGAGHSKFPGLPSDTIVSTAEEAEQFVRNRAAEGSDYIKLIADRPGPSQECLDAAVREARKLEMMVIVHACTLETFRMAIAARPHIITHVPMDQQLIESDAYEMAREGIACVPTLSMMRLSTNPDWDYKNAISAVATMHRCGVRLMAGSDAVDYPGAPKGNEHGDSLLREFGLLMDVGLSFQEVLASATRNTADFFGLKDRGEIERGMRADVILLNSDLWSGPHVLRPPVRVWCQGRPYQSADEL